MQALEVPEENLSSHMFGKEFLDTKSIRKGKKQ